jgi:hemoglobin
MERPLLQLRPVTHHAERSPSPDAPSIRSSSLEPNPHFSALGGTLSVERLVDRFCEHMDTLAEARAIRALHAEDLAPMKSVLVRYLTEWLGGPQLYSAEQGHPRLRKKHMRFAIGPAERDAWLLCMDRALGDVVHDTTLRTELWMAFTAVAEFLRNDPAHVHAPHG